MSCFYLSSPKTSSDNGILFSELGFLPLLESGLVDPSRLIADAKSGASGASVLIVSHRRNEAAMDLGGKNSKLIAVMGCPFRTCPLVPADIA